MSMLVDEFWPGTSTNQLGLDTGDLRKLVAPHDTFLYHLQCLCSRCVLLPLPLSDYVLRERVE